MHLKIIVAILGLSISGFFIFASLWIYQKNLKAERRALTEIAEIEEASAKGLPDPGLGYYRRAMKLIRQGRVVEARDLLLDLVRLYADSASFPEAKRVIGEINMDLLLSKASFPGKKEHIVQRGESLALIARRQKTSYDYILRVNGLFDDVIHPGDRLTVFPLDFSVVVKTREKTLTLMRKGRFFKEYPVEMVAFPPGLRAPFATEVVGKSANAAGRRVRVTEPEYADGDRWISLKRSGFQILPAGVEGQPTEEQLGDPEAALEQDLLYGVFIRPEDMYEVYTVLTLSSPISVTR